MSPTGSEGSFTTAPASPESQEGTDVVQEVEAQANGSNEPSQPEPQEKEVVVNGTETAKIRVGEVPPGDYRIIAWDLDTTGRRLLDEICHIGAYNPDGESKTFSQYVMPFRDPNPRAVQRHNLRVISTDRYRMLKNVKTGKLLRTKSEVAAVTDFVNWLKEAKGTKDGIILLSHESRNVLPLFLVQSVEKYQLFDEFCDVVKGFANGYVVAQRRCKGTLRSFTLRSVSRIFLNLSDNEEVLQNAADRAKTVYDSLSKALEEEPLKTEHILDMTTEVSTELHNLAEMRHMLTKHNTLRPIFEAALKKGWRERSRVTNLRRQLAEAGLDYSTLRTLSEEYGKTKEKMSQLFSDKLHLKPKEVDDLTEMVEKHFHPAESMPKSNLSFESKESGDASPVASVTKEENNSNGDIPEITVKAEAVEEPVPIAIDSHADGDH